MTRLEVAVRSPITFRRSLSSGWSQPIDVLKAPPETVGIEFEGRLFVWHAFEPRDDPDFGYEEFGPSVTVVTHEDDDERAAANDLQRFLSALAFWLDQPAEAVSFGGSGETDPYHPAIARARRTHAGLLAAKPPDAIVLRPETNLRLAVGYYREGMNAGSPFYRFLAFWNCLDAAFNVETDSTPRDDFIRREAPRLAWRWDNSRHPFPADPASDLERDSRHAVAHVLRPPGRRTIDPDLAEDRVRLDLEANLLKWLVRRAIEQEFPNPVSIARRWD